VLDAGINFVDTADVYSAGESEVIVGKALAGGRRDDVVLATKAHMPIGEDPSRRGSSRRWIIRAAEDSLRRLGTDWITCTRSTATTRAPASMRRSP
jgi:aryl-alcohol dehydrogenase-like predicted oxidoreductase